MPVTDFLGNIETVLTILAILLGGIWTYLKFIRDRVYRPRIAASVGGRIISRRGQRYLLASLELKNIGSGKFDVRQYGTGLRIECAENSTSEERKEVDWEHISTLSILQKHQWLEAKEPIQEQRLILVQKDPAVAYRIVFRMVSARKYWVRKKTYPWIEKRHLSWHIAGIAPSPNENEMDPGPDRITGKSARREK